VEFPAGIALDPSDVEMKRSGVLIYVLPQRIYGVTLALQVVDSDVTAEVVHKAYGIPIAVD
jgi:hypothetical protein